MTPAIGQIWTDNDPRMRNRSVRIVDIEGRTSSGADDGSKVVIRECDPKTGAFTGRRSRVGYARFPSAFGYSGLFTVRGDGH